MSLTPKEETVNLLIATLKTQNDLLATGLTLRQVNEIIIDTMLLNCPVGAHLQNFLTPPTKETT